MEYASFTGQRGGQFTTADAELAEVATGKVLATQIRQKNEEIEKLTGLDFGRFTKSMMLSQGNFAAFLNADENKRAELLEELTGTEVYGLVSMKVHEHHSQAKQQLHALQVGRQYLPSPQRRAKARSCNTSSRNYKSKQADTEQQIKTHDKPCELVGQTTRCPAKPARCHGRLCSEAKQAIAAAQVELALLEKSQPAERLRP